MSEARKELQEALCRYTTDTLTYIHTVRTFCEMFSKWMLCRDTEVEMMRDIKDRLETLDLNINHVTKSEEKGKAFVEYMKSKVNVDSKRAELEKELVEVLKDTASGLESLSSFLDAVEKLAVTSLHVFTENQVLHLPEGISPEYVQAVIMAARVICPLLLEFKRDDNVFFLPKPQNMEVLAYQLDRYIQTSKTICEKLDKSCFSDFGLKMAVETVVDLDVDLSEDDIQRMLDHVNQLDEIRMNEQFRMVFLFQEEPCHGFISEFDKRQPTMLQFLKELEETAVQLDRMNMGAKISSVAGSSVGAVGGVLSIVGLALSPFTAGVSLALTMTGAKGTLALSKSARAGFIAVNALFLGMDIFFICKDSISLAKGSETEVSQFIRARAALWSSEIDSWQKMHDSLNEGLPTSEKKKAVLETPIYLEMEVKKQSEAERVEPSAE
ncbi:uncharacterized protein LOC134625602 [Pelmatolapia mariae]|uniref:uncharacterized protein LOC134625602 n=1 Tax=Pelmatolapia mariae TaxID=158779 RepID=UPI002FE651AB